MSTKNNRQDALRQFHELSKQAITEAHKLREIAAKQLQLARQLRDGIPTPPATFSGVEIPRDLLCNPINCN